MKVLGLLSKFISRKNTYLDLSTPNFSFYCLKKTFFSTSNKNEYSDLNLSSKNSKNDKIEGSFSSDLTTSVFHGHLRKDLLNILQTSEKDVTRIVKREKEYFKKWMNFIEIKSREWLIDVNNVNDKFESKIKSDNEDIDGQTIGEYTYFSKSIKGRYIMFRKKINDKSSKEELVFDVAKVPFIKDIKVTSLKSIRVSDDNNFIAFIVEIDNNETTIGGIYNISEKYFLEKTFPNINFLDFSFEEDTLIVVYNDVNIRPSLLLEYNLKTKKELKIISSKDNLEHLEIIKSQNNKFFINFVSKNHSTIYLYDYINKKTTLLLPKIPNVKYFIEYSKSGGYFIMSNLNKNKAKTYILSKGSNEEKLEDSLFMSDYEQYKIFYVDEKLASSAKDSIDLINNLSIVVSPSKTQFFEQMEMFENHLVIYCKNLIKPQILVYDIKEKKLSEFSVFDQVGEISSGFIKVSYLN